MSGPLVSIVTPSLNQVRHVEDCLVSVAAQDYANIEHVVVDGGSTDGTLDVIRRHEGGRVQVFLRPGTSQAQALNEALGRSTGEIVGWLNTDDAYFGVDAVSTAVARFSSSVECVAVYGDAVVVDDAGRVLRHVATSAQRLVPLRTTSSVVQPATFIRRSALAERFLREDLHLTLDYELWLYLRSKGPFCKVDRVLAIDRDYPGRKIRAPVAEVLEELHRLRELYGHELESRGAIGRAASAWLWRARGVRELVTLERKYRVSFSCRLDSRWRRGLRQLGLPQRYLHVG